MLKILNPQLDVFTAEFYNQLVPKNHLLVPIADAVDSISFLKNLSALIAILAVALTTPL